MKHVSIFVLGLFMVLNLYSQDNSVVTLAVAGNKNLQLAIDGRSYNSSNASVSGDKTTFNIPGLETGSHVLLLFRTDPNTMRQGKTEGEFFLRNGYNLLINVNRDGSLELIESRMGAADNLLPISTSAYNTLLRNVRLQKSVAGRRNLLAKAFSEGRNSFLTSQLSQLLTLVNSESFRLQLAKSAFPITRDRGNFYQLYSLLNSQAAKNELADYVYQFDSSDIIAAMPESAFNDLYQSIRQQWPVSTQMNSLSAAFNDTNHYFTTSQAGRLIQLVNAENNRLQLAKLSYRSITDPDNFSQVADLLNSQASRNELESYVNNYNNGSSTGGPMTDANFNALYQAIQQQWPVSTQMNSLASAFNNTSNFFTTYQAGRLIQLVSAENNRLQLAKLSYRGITDRNNFYQLRELLSSQAARDELEAYVNAYNPGGSGNTGSKTPMSDADFSQLYETISRQYLPNEQMSTLTQVFSNASYYFTTAQVKLLIPLVSLESNRLKLAKLAYSGLTDRPNYTQLYDLFTSQASRNELDAYVRAYKD